MILKLCYTMASSWCCNKFAMMLQVHVRILLPQSWPCLGLVFFMILICFFSPYAMPWCHAIMSRSCHSLIRVLCSNNDHCVDDAILQPWHCFVLLSLLSCNDLVTILTSSCHHILTILSCYHLFVIFFYFARLYFDIIIHISTFLIKVLCVWFWLNF